MARSGDNSFRYSGVSNWRPPLQWTLTTNVNLWHPYSLGLCNQSGSGNQTATWKIPVLDAGQYDLFYWVTNPMNFAEDTEEVEVALPKKIQVSL